MDKRKRGKREGGREGVDKRRREGGRKQGVRRGRERKEGRGENSGIEATSLSLSL